MLSEQDAVVIYQEKISLLQKICHTVSSRKQVASLWGQTGPISKRFGVSSRTVKYIWNRQTWAYATNHLWPSEAMLCQIMKNNRMALMGTIANRVQKYCPQTY